MTTEKNPEPPLEREHLEHLESLDCWCCPYIDYVDPETGVQVIVHRQPN